MKNKVNYIYSEDIKTEKKCINEEYLTKIFNTKYYNIILKLVQENTNY